MRLPRKTVLITAGSLFALALVVTGLYFFEDWVKYRAHQRRIQEANAAVQQDLHMIHFALEAYKFPDKSAPASLAEMDRDATAKTLLANRGLQPKIRSGRYVVLWGTPTVKLYGAMTLERSNRILLGYDIEPDPGGSRNVVMSDGCVGTLTTEEFEEALRSRQASAGRKQQ